MPAIEAVSSSRGVGIGCRPSVVKMSSPGAIAEGATGVCPWTAGWLIRPTCHSWAKIRPPLACTASVTLRQPATWASAWMPGVNG